MPLELRRAVGRADRGSLDWPPTPAGLHPWKGVCQQQQQQLRCASAAQARRAPGASGVPTSTRAADWGGAGPPQSWGARAGTTRRPCVRTPPICLSTHTPHLSKHPGCPETARAFGHIDRGERRASSRFSKGLLTHERLRGSTPGLNCQVPQSGSVRGSLLRKKLLRNWN